MKLKVFTSESLNPFILRDFDLKWEAKFNFWKSLRSSLAFSLLYFFPIISKAFEFSLTVFRLIKNNFASVLPGAMLEGRELFERTLSLVICASLLVFLLSAEFEV